MKIVKLEDVCYSGTSNISQKDVMILDGSYPIYGASGFIKNINFYKSEKPYIAIVKDGSGVGRTMILPEKSSVIGTMQYIFPRDNIDIRYLYYAITSMDLSKYCTGIAIPHIYFKDYKKEKLNLPSISEQVNIANKLDLMQKTIDLKQEQVEYLDELIKSQFVNMFGTKEEGFRCERVEFNKCIKNMLKGPFGSDIKKSLYVPKSKDTYKVYIQINAINKNQQLGDYWISKEYFENKMFKFELKPNDYIATCDGTLGKLLRLNENMEKGIISSSLLRITLDESIIKPKYFENVWTLYMLNEMKKNIRNACLKHLPSAKVIGKIHIPLPSMESQVNFSNFVNQIEKQKIEIQKSLKEVQKLQESLMNKYFR